MLTNKIKRIGIIIIASLIGIYIFASYIFPKFISVPFAAWNSHQAWKNMEEINHEDFDKKDDFEYFKNGRWINETDSLAGIEIKNGKWILFYKGETTDQTEIYEFTVTNELPKYANTDLKPGEFLILTNESDTLNYEILGYDKEFLSLMYFPKGNILTYRKEK